MKNDFRKWWFLVGIVALAFGLYFLGQAGINTIDPNYNFAGESEQLLSARSTSLIQFFFGLLAAVSGVFIFLVLLKTKPEDEEL